MLIISNLIWVNNHTYSTPPDFYLPWTYEKGLFSLRQRWIEYLDIDCLREKLNQAIIEDKKRLELIEKEFKKIEKGENPIDVINIAEKEKCYNNGYFHIDEYCYTFLIKHYKQTILIAESFPKNAEYVYNWGQYADWPTLPFYMEKYENINNSDGWALERAAEIQNFWKNDFPYPEKLDSKFKIGQSGSPFGFNDYSWCLGGERIQYKNLALYFDNKYFKDMPIWGYGGLILSIIGIIGTLLFDFIFKPLSLWIRKGSFKNNDFGDK